MDFKECALTTSIVTTGEESTNGDYSSHIVATIDAKNMELWQALVAHSAIFAMDLGIQHDEFMLFSMEAWKIASLPRKPMA